MNRNALIGIANYGLGNIKSVYNAFAAIEANVKIICSAQELSACSHIVLPGVGAFGDGMIKLAKNGWIEVLNNEIKERRKWFFGICLGMQLIAKKSYELGEHQGLGWINATVERLPAAPSLRIPHIGWNDVKVAGSSRLLKGIPDCSDFYFVHSYYVNVADKNIVTGWCNYAIDFAAVLETENIMATQFHPEKSQKPGLSILKNFSEL
jgi:glutamine amidotransferase